MTTEEAIQTFGFNPDTIGLRHRGWYIVKAIGEEEENGGAKIGYLAVKTRDGGSNKLDASACWHPNFAGTSEDGFDCTYRYYYYSPLRIEKTTKVIAENVEVDIETLRIANCVSCHHLTRKRAHQQIIEAVIKGLEPEDRGKLEAEE